MPLSCTCSPSGSRRRSRSASSRPSWGSRPPIPHARSGRSALKALADQAGLDPQFAEKFLNFVIAEVIRHHEAIAGRENAAR